MDIPVQIFDGTFLRKQNVAISEKILFLIQNFFFDDIEMSKAVILFPPNSILDGND